MKNITRYKVKVPEPVLGIVEDWCIFLENKGLSGTTIETHLNLIRRFLKHLDSDISNIQQAYLRTMDEALQGSRRMADSSRLRLHFSIMSLINFFYFYGAIKDKELVNQIAKLKPKIKSKDQKRTYLSVEDYVNLLEENRRSSGNSQLDKDLTEVLIVLYAELGARVSELVEAEITDIDFEKNLIFIRHAKGGKPRYIGLNDNARAILRKLIKLRPLGSNKKALLLNAKGEPLTRRAIYQRIHKLGKRIGLDISPHSLRRTNARNLILKAGLSPLAVSDHLGHSRSNTTTLGQCYCITDEYEVASLVSSASGIISLTQAFAPGCNKVLGGSHE